MNQKQYDFCKLEIARTESSIREVKDEIDRLKSRADMINSIIEVTEAQCISLLEDSIATYPKQIDDLQSKIYFLDRNLYLFRSVIEAIPENIRQELEANMPDLEEETPNHE